MTAQAASAFQMANVAAPEADERSRVQNPETARAEHGPRRVTAGSRARLA
jgi:hypothetical protein